MLYREEKSINYMRNKKRVTKQNILWCLILLIMIAATSFVVFGQQRTLPENPLTQKEDSSLMLIAEGNALSISSEALDNIENKGKANKDSEKKNKNEKQKGREKSKENKQGDKPTKDKNGEEDGNPSSGGKTDVIYFTTTIKDGETVTKKDYNFSVNHKIPELEPQETKIFVNGKLSEHIKDARTDFTVFLNEGENEIKVQVTYKNQQGQLISPYKKYIVNVDTRHLVINTSLKDGQKVESAYLSFTASASFGTDDVDVLVNLESEEIYQNDGLYEAELKKGENLITIWAEYDAKHKISEEYRIYYDPPKGMHIETDLKNQTVKSESAEFSFRAEVIGGNSKTKFTVTFNNKTISGENGKYDVILKPQGEKAYNTVRLRATDGKEEESLTFKIKYIPIATPETEPVITHINIKNGQTISKSNPFTLELAAEDYKGNKIYFDGMEVYLNGKHQILRDTKPYVTYKLNFSEGSNTVKAIITDDDGRFKEFIYTIIYRQPDENEKTGTISMTIDANVIGKGTLLSASNVDIFASDNLASVIIRTIEKKGMSCSYSGTSANGFYLKAINRSGIGNQYKIPESLRQEINDFGISWRGGIEESPEHNINSLGEFDYTDASGWMILRNGNFLGESASGVDVSDGDIIKIRFTLAHGMDIGGSYHGSTFNKTY